MFAYYATSLLTTVTSLALGLFVFCKNPKNPLHRSLLRLNTAVALWSFFLFLHYLSHTEHAAFFTLKMLHSAAVFIPACYLHFVINLLGTRKKRALRISYLISMVFLIINFTPYFISGVASKLYFRFYATAGSLYAAWIIAYLAIAGYGIYLLLTNYPLASPIKKIQIKYVLFASIIGFLGASSIYPLFYNIPIPPIGEHIIFLYPIIFAVAVLRHNILDLNIVIKRTLVYSISVLLITLVYLITVLLLERLLRNMVGYQSLWITVVAAVSIALLFNPIKNKVQSIIDKFYINSAYQRFERELIESNKSKALANLAAGLAHEIKNPLTSIKTFTEYLPKKYNDADFRNNFYRIVKCEVDKINSLVTQLLEFAKPSGLQASNVNVHEILDYTLDLLSNEMIKSNIRIVKDYSRNREIIRADQNKLKLVFFNIIKNGLEAMEDGGTLTIATASTEENFKITIQDTGYGIKNINLNRIFQPFFSTKEKGTGLGLSVVQNIITEHGGIIYAKSKVASGTIFTIVFPLATL